MLALWEVWRYHVTSKLHILHWKIVSEYGMYYFDANA